MQRQDSLIESLKGEIVWLKNNVTDNKVKQQANIQHNMDQIKMMKEQANYLGEFYTITLWWTFFLEIHLEVDLI